MCDGVVISSGSTFLALCADSYLDVVPAGVSPEILWIALQTPRRSTRCAGCCMGGLKVCGVLNEEHQVCGVLRLNSSLCPSVSFSVLSGIMLA